MNRVRALARTPLKNRPLAPYHTRPEGVENSVELTSYERVKMALRHQEPDRVPFDLGGAEVAGINIHALRNLKRYLNMSPEVSLGEQDWAARHCGRRNGGEAED